MNVTKIQYDDAFEEEGLITITFWLDEEPPGYVSLCRETVESPSVVYIELYDQIYGYETRDATFEIKDNVLTLHLKKDFPFLQRKNKIEFSIAVKETERVFTKLKSIFDIQHNTDAT